MLPVLTTDEMRAFDREAMDMGLPGFTLMETAGRAVAYTTLELLETAAPGHVAVVCGPGGNGGDGFVVARVLRDHGVDVRTYIAVPRDKIAGDALAHLELFARCGGTAIDIADPRSFASHDDVIANASVVVDALFGIGVVRPILGYLAHVLSAMNRAAVRIAVDVPSGLDTNTGAIPRSEDGEGAIFEATHTVTVAALKVALVGAPGFAHCGEVTVVDIGVPAGVSRTELAWTDERHHRTVGTWQLEESDVIAKLPLQTLLDHKGTRGHAVVISGAPEMRGAGRLAATAALRIGAGLVTLAGDGEVSCEDEDAIMTRSIQGAQLDDLLAKKGAVVIGPGLGKSEIAEARVRDVLGLGVPAVIDADALNILSSSTVDLAKAAGPIVVTPHPGEAARLLGISTDEVESDRLAAARKLADITRSVVVLKGARTVICDGTSDARSFAGQRFCFINPTGAPSLATGGTGDVLAGTIGGLLAQRLDAFDAACCAVFLHGRAGEQLFARYGRGALSSDLPLVIAELIGTMTPKST